MDETAVTHSGRRRLDPYVFQLDFLDTLEEGIVLVDEEGVVVDCNRTGARLLGRGLEDLLEFGIRAVLRGAVHEDGKPFRGGEDPLSVTLRSGEACVDVIMGVEVPGQAQRWLRVNTSVLTGEGQIRGAIASFDDATERIQQAHFLKLLLEVNRIVMVASDETDFFQRLCDVIVEVGGFVLASIAFARGSLGGRARGEVDISFSAGRRDYLYEGIWSWSGSEAIGRGPSGTALRTGLSQVSNDPINDPDFEPWRTRAQAFGIGSVAAIPFSSGRRQAVLTVFHERPFGFDDLAKQGLGVIAEEAAFCADHVRSTKQLETALDGTVALLSRALEVATPSRGTHPAQVGALSGAIASQLGLDERLIELIRASGAVHDIGELAVLPELLELPEQRASSAERAGHTKIGADLLTRAQLPWPLAEVALQHHERLDGSGFPHGLHGGEIILPARIIAVADVIVSVCIDDGDLGRALEEVRDGSGTLFDPDVVEASHELFDAGFRLEDYAAGT
jgi:hypothetical protein